MNLQQISLDEATFIQGANPPQWRRIIKLQLDGIEILNSWRLGRCYRLTLKSGLGIVFEALMKVDGTLHEHFYPHPSQTVEL